MIDITDSPDITQWSEFVYNYAKKYGKVVNTDIFNANYENNFFDTILMFHVLEHLDDPVKTLKEIRRILKPNGKLIISTPDFDCAMARKYGNSGEIGKSPVRRIS